MNPLLRALFYRATFGGAPPGNAITLGAVAITLGATPITLG